MALKLSAVAHYFLWLRATAMEPGCVVVQSARRRWAAQRTQAHNRDLWDSALSVRAVAERIRSAAALVILTVSYCFPCPHPIQALFCLLENACVYQLKTGCHFWASREKCVRWNEWMRRWKIWEQCWVYYKKTRQVERRGYKSLCVWWAARGWGTFLAKQRSKCAFLY